LPGMKKSRNSIRIGRKNNASIGRRRSIRFWPRVRHMTDVEFTRALERGEIATQDFHHASHLHVAWVYLAESSSLAEAAAKMSNTLRNIAATASKSEKYHETITLFWIYILARVRIVANGKSLEQIVQQHPQLLEKNFPLVYYSPELLFSDRARNSWIGPDLKSLSVNAVTICSSCSSGDAPDWSLSR